MEKPFSRLSFAKIYKKVTILTAYHVIASMDLVLISHNLNLIGPAKILA